jgi:hypothetical protein
MLFRGSDDEFWVPQSRHTTVRREDIENVPELKILSSSEEAGVYAIATAKGRQIFITGHSEYDRDTLKKEYLRDKKILAAHGRLVWKRDKEYYGQDAWRGKLATEGGGVLINQAIHTIDLLQYLLGMPTKLTAWCSNLSLQGVIDVEELACRLMELLHKFYPQTLLERYKVEAPLGTPGWELLEMAGRARGFLMARAEVNTERMAKVLLDEFRSGKLGKFTLEMPEE